MGPTRVQARKGGGMTFRDFTEETKEAVTALVAGVRGARDITPMVHLQSEDSGRELIAVDARYFNEGRVQELVEGFIVPVVQERMATQVAWTFTSAIEDSTRIVTAVVIDREVNEVWAAHIGDDNTIGEWTNLGTNTTQGLLIEPVQEALR